MKRGRSGIILTCIGAAIGILFSFSPGGLFILALTILSIQIIRHVIQENERPFLLSIFIGGMAFRVVLVVLAVSVAGFSGRILNYSAQGSPDYSAAYIFDDEGYYTLRAWFTAMDWQAEPLDTFTEKAIVKNKYGFSGFIYVLALFFKSFGYSPVSSRFINCLLGAWTGILVYFTLKNIFDERSAKLAGVLAAFWPSLVLWSITNLKETSVTLLFCLMLFFLTKLQITRKARYLGFVLLAISSIGFIRSYSYGMEFVIIASGIVVSYIVYLQICGMPVKKRTAVLMSLFVIACFFIFFGRGKINSSMESASQKMISRHKLIILSEKGKCYKLMPYQYYVMPEKINGSLAMAVFARGWFHLMLEPVPWRIQSIGMMAVFPQMLLWYFLIPFAVFGAVILAKSRLKESVALIAYFFITASILAVTEGNIGTVFRHRDITTPFFLMFASAGLTSAFCGFKDDKIDR